MKLSYCAKSLVINAHQDKGGSTHGQNFGNDIGDANQSWPRFNPPWFSLKLGRCPLNLAPIIVYPEQVVPNYVPIISDSPTQSRSSKLSLNSHQVDKYWGCKMSSGVAKLNIGGASATSKVYKVPPWQHEPATWPSPEADDSVFWDWEYYRYSR